MNIITSNKYVLRLKFILTKVQKLLKKQGKLTVFGDLNYEINKVYVINLDRQKARWKMLSNELSKIKVGESHKLIDFTTRFPAIDASKDELSNDVVHNSYKLEDQYFVDPDPRLLYIIREKEITINLTAQEIAVALSHISIWKKIVANEISNSLILEDDVYFESTFTKKLNSIWNEINSSKLDFDILFISYKPVAHNPSIEYISQNLAIPERGIWWFSGYILSLKGAKKLLNKLPITGPIDLWINHEFKKINVLISNKSIVNQKLFLQSDNNYSILPILSQVGIKSNQTFIELEKSKGKNPVFIFDNSNRSNNNFTIINILLSLNSYKVYRNYTTVDESHILKLLKEKKPLLFDAYLGFNSIIEKVSDLASFYPNSIFIILNDDTDDNEVENIHYIKNNNPQLLKKISSILKIKNWRFSNVNFSQITYDNSIVTENVKISNLYKYLEHDVNPWILALYNISKYLPYSEYNQSFCRQYKSVIAYEDFFNKFNSDYWVILEETFPSNMSFFTKKNFEINKLGFELKITNEPIHGKPYSSASLRSKDSLIYGSAEIIMKPIKGAGIVSAFFLHRNDPWQEIDIEFTGDDTTKILLNVYYNPGVENSKFNYGVRGTPVLIDLDFDASEEFHSYRIEWEKHEIRWYVDNKIIHIRKVWTPTPIPDLPLHVFVNVWVTNSKELAGNFDKTKKHSPLKAKSIKIMKYQY